MTVDRALIAAVRDRLAAAADPVRAPAMQAYMKSAMPYHGVPSPGVKAICKELFATHPLDGVGRWRDTALSLWRTARYREERYIAIALTGHKLYRAHQTPEALPIYEEMIVDGAWWDYVDEVGIHRVGPLLGAHRAAVEPAIRAWSVDHDVWRRRASIICQIGFRGDADLDLLYACIEPNMGDRDFFIRKSIGWALRTYAWADPDEVVRYVAANDQRLSPLSKREALKNVNRTR